MDIIPFRSSRGCLSYLVLDPVSREAALIDPSDEIADASYLSVLDEHAARLRYLIETHTHADHLSSAARLKKRTRALLVRHAQAPSPEKDLAVTGNEDLPLGTSALQVLATPGHTDESISIVVDGAVFTGDALLIGGTGRTDFQLGDSAALYDSLHTTLAPLPDETIVYPAHDYKGRTSSTMGDERRTNPRLALARDEFINIMEAYRPPAPELFDEAIAANSR